MSLCTITLAGNVGRDPEGRYTPGGTFVADFSVAVNQSRPDANAESGWTEETDWFRVTAWGKLGERIAETLKKGDRVLVAGTFRSREWTDRNNAVRTSLEVSAASVSNLGKPASRDDRNGVGDAADVARTAAAVGADPDLPF